MTNITIATANTHESRLLQFPDGLVHFQRAHVDVLLLQEVLAMKTADIIESLMKANFKLVHRNQKMGLLIAVSNQARITTAVIDDVIFDIPGITQVAKKFGIKKANSSRERGIIGVRLTCESGQAIAIATVHHSVFIRGLTRSRQVLAMGRALRHESYDSSRLIIGGDMNHYPRARRIDIATQNSLGLARVDIIKPSWKIKGTQHEWMARLGSITTGRKINSFDAELDAILYKGVEVIDTQILDIESDHRAIVTEFRIL